MVKFPHEGLHRIFQDDSMLFLRAFQKLLDIEFPEPRAISVINSDLTEMEPMERRADTILLVEADGGEHLLIIESQSTGDDDKRRSWPYYIAFLHDKYRAPVTLLVVCSRAVTAAWAREPIPIGLTARPSLVAYPLVLGPDNVPVILEVDEAADDVVLAVFSALAHKGAAQAGRILEALAEALNTIDPQSAAYLAEFTEIGLAGAAAFDMWRMLMTTMTYPYQSQLRSQGREEGREEGRAAGRAEGEARAVLRVLERRGVDVSEHERQRVMSCTDQATLELWLDRALVADSVDDLFV
ncbi:hypothetical protein EF847_04505 [Actinobacteria bacterium YIM 96077]|uniref:DUF4351 domain-containing protein n=2 Tax=Phytoactinopolyspora halophila TaxID=1981511 RepID=A0A329R2T8_9ACTN|nr:hypothetical protein EF847_04505 [Actinobacteria bacterium YIM 96077]RAW18683.1 hypothetical protein DPM12_01005 [Phytoactinopolyspora halophila]